MRVLSGQMAEKVALYAIELWTVELSENPYWVPEVIKFLYRIDIAMWNRLSTWKIPRSYISIIIIATNQVSQGKQNQLETIMQMIIITDNCPLNISCPLLSQINNKEE